MNLAFLGRQPIFTADLDVFAYEILFRSGQTSNAALVQDGDQATASVVLNLLTDIGLERVVNDRPAFINMTRNLLLYADLSCLPPQRIVLEILEDITPDPEVLAAVRRLAEAGFTIALDDVVYRQELEPLIELADIIKVDLPQIPLAELPEHVAALQRYPVKLLVEKVETQEEFDLCRKLGFSYF
ncbi:MAG: EAL domain-containing protein, partial [Planctomycetales bacterium]|nr:EAL domain-containing protein [Planctomycetales bacterium]